MTLQDDMAADTETILDEWEETLTVKRGIITYDDKGVASESLSTLGTFEGDWQPVTGQMYQEEVGNLVLSDARVITEVADSNKEINGIAITENDRIYREDGTFEYVNYMKYYEDHTTIMLKKTKEG